MYRILHLTACVALELLVTCSTARAQVRVDEVYSFPRRTNHSGLIQASDGNFYGTASDGYAAGLGAVYRLTPDGLFTVLHEFTGGEDGAQPLAALVQGSDGFLYGTAHQGGSLTFGTIYRMTLDGTFTVVHTFTNGDDGGQPYTGGLTPGRDGNFYGTSEGSCTNLNCGSVIFRLTPSGTFTTLYTFRSSCDFVTQRLVEAADGNFYGTGWCGGSQGWGMVFRMTRESAVTVVYNFSGGMDGFYPRGGLIAASDGNLYGTTERGGAHDNGTLFRLTPSGTKTVLDSFTFELDGYSSQAPLVQGSDGFLYGTMYLGGGAGYSGYGGGTIFRTTLDGTITILHRFLQALLARGADPDVALVEASDRRMYGVASSGFNGTVFRLPATSSSEMVIDTPHSGDSLTEPFVIRGWALDHTAQFDAGIDSVHVWALPVGGGNPVFVGTAGCGTGRPDVAAVFGKQFERSGFGVTVRGLAPGTYQFVATPHSGAWNDFDFPAARTVTLSITSSNATQPLAAIDTPVAGSSIAQPFGLGGWAIDLASPGGSGIDTIHVWAYPTGGGNPVFVGVASYGASRPDVANAFGLQFDRSGFGLTVNGLPAGAYDLAVFPHSTVTGSFGPAQLLRVTVVRTAFMNVDIPGPMSIVTQPLSIEGWAIDIAARSGTGVDTIHVWAYPARNSVPVFLGVATYGVFRPDVGAVFGSQFVNVGYRVSVSGLPPDTYTVVVYPHSTVVGTFNDAQAVTVTVR